jgi:hypothetical protein
MANIIVNKRKEHQMPKGIYKRKKKLGRPKGVKNKLKELMQSKNPWNETDYKIGSILRIKMPKDYIASDGPKLHVPTEPPSLISRLEAATIKYETAINEAIQALKGN